MKVEIKEIDISNCRKVGLLDNKGFEESQRVYDTEYCSPTIKIGGIQLRLWKLRNILLMRVFQ